MSSRPGISGFVDVRGFWFSWGLGLRQGFRVYGLGFTAVFRVRWGLGLSAHFAIFSSNPNQALSF